MPEEVDPDDLVELTELAAALAGDPAGAARLVGESLASTHGGRRTPDRSGLRSLVVEGYLRLRQPFPVPPGEDLPGELGEVAARLADLTPFQRAALVLFRLRALPLSEVAGVLDSSPSVVRRRLEEAEERLGADPLTIRATLETLSWRTPDPAAVAAAQFRAQQTTRRRRARLRLVAVALGIVLLAALVVPTVRMLQPLPVRTAGDWVLGLELDPPSGWTVELHAVTPDQEYLQLIGAAGVCRVVAMLPSAVEKEGNGDPAAGERAWVGGRTVRYSDDGVRWPYGAGGEVTLTCPDQDRAAVLGMAERMQFSAGRPFTLPFALSRLPAGLRLVGAGYEDELPIIALAGRASDAFVLVTVADSAPIGRRVTVDGVDYRLQSAAFSRRLCRPLQSMAVCVEAQRNDDAAPKEVFKYLKLAPDLKDRSTWFDARRALTP